MIKKLNETIEVLKNVNCKCLDAKVYIEESLKEET